MTETVTVYRREGSERTYVGSVEAESASKAKNIARRLFTGNIEIQNA